MNRLNDTTRVQVLRCLVDGMSVRATSRVTGVAKNTILKIVVDFGTLCSALHDEMVRGLTPSRVEMDEIWSFVGAKQKNATDAQKDAGMGDAWTWTALDAEHKLVISWLVGARDGEYARAFVADVAERIVPGWRFQITTDGHKPYLEAIEAAFGADVDYAMLIKEYGNTSDHRSADTRYSPNVCTGSEVRIISGNPNRKFISTSYIERQNLTMRMSTRRLTRLTNAFSKKIENHEHAIAIYFFNYNFCRTHQTLRVTPAMAAGVTDRAWELEDIVAQFRALEDAREAQLGPRRTRGKSVAE